MTDNSILLQKLENHSSQIQNAYRHLTSTNPQDFWTSGQWMTEKRGGSDVGKD